MYTSITNVRCKLHPIRLPSPLRRDESLPDYVHRMAMEDTNGRLLGYGSDIVNGTTVPVILRDEQGEAIYGFHADPATTRAIADAHADRWSRILVNIEIAKPGGFKLNQPRRNRRVPPTWQTLPGELPDLA
jgi:hypothetical protein